jgi:sec-independent protein translocase protein TatA
MLFGISLWKLLFLLAIVLLLFGTRLPVIARSLGQTVVEFKRGFKEIGGPSADDVDQKK